MVTCRINICKVLRKYVTNKKFPHAFLGSRWFERAKEGKMHWKLDLINTIPSNIVFFLRTRHYNILLLGSIWTASGRLNSHRAGHRLMAALLEWFLLNFCSLYNDCTVVLVSHLAPPMGPCKTRRWQRSLWGESLPTQLASTLLFFSFFPFTFARPNQRLWPCKKQGHDLCFTTPKSPIELPGTLVFGVLDVYLSLKCVRLLAWRCGRPVERRESKHLQRGQELRAWLQTKGGSAKLCVNLAEANHNETSLATCHQFSLPKTGPFLSPHALELFYWAVSMPWKILNLSSQRANGQPRLYET